MSEDNVETLRMGYEALARGDLAAALSTFDPDVQVEDHSWSLTSPITGQGTDGFMEILRTVNEGFEDVRYTPEEFTAAGDRVLVKAMRTGRGSASGVEVREQQFHVFDFEGGLVVRFRSFLKREKALEAAGLPQ
jgi:ketosteroid isomerase-like protein